MIDSDIVSISAFVRGSLDPSAFEKWLLDADEIEFVLGIDLYLAAICTDFNAAGEVVALRSRLLAWLSSTKERLCLCLLWPDSHQCALGAESSSYIPEHFSVLRRQSPWVQLVRCDDCLQLWYSAIDTVDDEMYFVRLSQEQGRQILEHATWPATFDNLAHVWPRREIGPTGAA